MKLDCDCTIRCANDACVERCRPEVYPHYQPPEQAVIRPQGEAVASLPVTLIVPAAWAVVAGRVLCPGCAAECEKESC